jgi:hypothetical protein
MIVPKRYWQIAKRLTTAQLQKDDGDDQIINESDLFNLDIGRRGRNFFLGFYSLEGLKLAFEKYEVIRALNEKGFKDIVYDLDTSDPYVHRLTLFNKQKCKDDILIELVLKKYNVVIDMPFKTPLNGKCFETVAIEWMCLQNPYVDFSKKRPRLPGQKFPGLGLASKSVELLMIMSWRLNLAGLVNTPDHYHNAYLYSKIFYYLNPEFQARLMAIARDLKSYPLDTIAWAIEWDAVLDLTTGKPLKWMVGKQIVPFNNDLKRLFDSREYNKIVKTKMKDHKFKLDIEKFNEIKAQRSHE